MSTGSSSSNPSATLAALAGEAQLGDRVRFVVELDRLKQVLRRTVVTDGIRRENTAEHSWHVAMMALVLADPADEPVDPMRVAKLLLVQHGITAAQVRAVNSTIGDGSAALWELARRVIDDAVTRGWLPETGR